MKSPVESRGTAFGGLLGQPPKWGLRAELPDAEQFLLFDEQF